MLDENRLRTVSDLVEAAIGDTQAVIHTISGREDEPSMQGYAEFGIPWQTASCQSQSGLQDVAAYRAQVDNPSNSAWMDNTTLVTACALMSPRGPEVITPLTVWDLATFTRAVVCYERIYHHEHPDIHDAVINQALGGEVLKGVPLPFRATQGTRILPDPWDGAHRFMCDTWSDSHYWLKRLHESVGKDTLDGKQVAAVTEAWRAALNNPDLQATDLVNFRDVDRRWRSPSNQLLVDTANITGLDDTRLYLDPREEFRRLAQRKVELGLEDESEEERGHVLSDLNLRAYVNQQLAEFFGLPYACSTGRLPFRRFLYNRSIKIQQELTTAKIIDNRYAELAGPVKLRVPVFLALALRGANTAKSLWYSVAELRSQATAFRARRQELDRALERGDLKEAAKLSKALHTSVDSLLSLAGNVTTAAGGVIVEKLSKGDIKPVSTAVGVAAAAVKGALKTSFAQRVLWRLRQPQLLWTNDVIDQAQHLTEAMPDLARVWEIPPNQHTAFAERFQKMAQLAG